MKFTVFTPTYNRAFIISKLFDSLKKQTFTDFEWVVIDDGSSDNTEQLFENWKDEANFPILYKKVNNGGKHRAINQALKIARGELFFIVDSDDYLPEDSLERVDHWYSTIEGQDDFCAVAGLRGFSKDMMNGSTFENESGFFDTTAFERYDHNILGDKAEVFITEILKKFPFKEFPNENFLTESTVHFEMAGQGYKIRYFNEIIYIGEYLEGGLTNNFPDYKKGNLRGKIYTYQIFDKYKRMNFSQKSRRCAYIYLTAKDQKELSMKTIANELGVSPWFLRSSYIVLQVLEKIRKIRKTK